MIATDMKYYDIYTTASDGYGQTNPDFENAIGKVKMAVYITDFNTQRNTVFGASQFVGLTTDSSLLSIGQYVGIAAENYLHSPIGYKAAEITYIYRKGRYHQVFLKETSHTLTPAT